MRINLRIDPQGAPLIYQDMEGIKSRGERQQRLLSLAHAALLMEQLGKVATVVRSPDGQTLHLPTPPTDHPPVVAPAGTDFSMDALCEIFGPPGLVKT